MAALLQLPAMVDRYTILYFQESYPERVQNHRVRGEVGEVPTRKLSFAGVRSLVILIILLSP